MHGPCALPMGVVQSDSLAVYLFPLVFQQCFSEGNYKMFLKPQECQQYPVNGIENYTQVTTIHPYHGTVIYYLSADDFQDTIMSLLVPCWVNGMTVVITEMK